MKHILNNLLRMPKKAIFSIENSVLKTVSIHTSRDFRVALVRLINEIETGLHSIKIVDIPNIEIKVLEHCDDVFLALYHFNLYKKNGWKMMRDVKPINPTLKSKIVHSMVGDAVEKIVYIKTGKNKHIVLGIFNKNDLADEFFNSVPFIDGIPMPVYALNQLTRTYYKEEIVRKGLIADLLKYV